MSRGGVDIDVVLANWVSCGMFLNEGNLHNENRDGD